VAINWPTKTMIDWVVSNLMWELFAIIFVFVFLKFIPGIIGVIKISKFILKDNRNTRGNGWGKYSADRFLDIWYSNLERPLKYEVGHFYYNRFTCDNSRHWMNVIDDELNKLGLIEIYECKKGYKAVKPIRGWRNTIVKMITEFYLTKFIGDDPQYYKDLENQSKI
jgi:hypothetical protein